ncbi:hypothetical protein J6590_006429 [Homalodisca vitripennis]|nr:hypothetical protein J6590_006429 [Homalodisca vitripennis]
MKWSGVVIAGLLVAVAVVRAEGEIWEENDHEVLIRSERGTKNNKVKDFNGCAPIHWTLLLADY